MIKRIKSLISVKNLTASQFADLLGVQRSNISHILSGRNNPSLDFILKIAEQFPTVSIEWLLQGKGEMFLLGDKEIPGSINKLEIKAPESYSDLFAAPELSKEVPNRRDIEKEPITTPEEHPPLTERHKEETHDHNLGGEHVSLAMDDKDIEQVMVLYKNGSFRVYTPQK